MDGLPKGGKEYVRIGKERDERLVSENERSPSFRTGFTTHKPKTKRNYKLCNCCWYWANVVGCRSISCCMPSVTVIGVNEE